MSRNRDGDCCPRIKQYALCLLMVLSMVLVVIVCVLLGIWISIRTAEKKAFQTTMCFNQSDLPVYPHKQIEIPTNFSNSTMNNETTFCGLDSEVLTFLAEMALEFYYDCDIHPESKFFHELIPKTCKSTSKTETVVKLTELRTDHLRNSTLDGHSVILWKSEGNRIGNIKYLPDKGTVKIQRNGLYFVTSQISMELNHTDTQLGHFLYKRYTNGTEERLLVNRKMLCDPVTTPLSMRLSSTVGAVFVLNDSDSLFVATSTPEYLVSDPSSCNFIVYAI